MRFFLVLVIIFSSIPVAHATESPPAHPSVIGTWSFTPMDGECSQEKFQFLPNKLLLITSRNEAIESLYELSISPVPTGSFKLNYTLTKRSGKKDCADQGKKVGDKIVLFVRFHVSGEEFLLCETDGLDKCYGQATRIREHAPYKVDEEAIKIMENMVSKYHSFSTYSDQGHSVQTLTREIGEQGPKNTIEFETLFKRPSQFRFAWIHYDNFSGVDSDKERSTIWSDGVKAWSSLSFDDNKPTLEKDFAMASASSTGVSQSTSHDIPRLLSDQISGFRLDQLEGLGMVGTEMVDDVESYVLQGHHSSGNECKLWIGKNDYLLRKIVEVAIDGTHRIEERTHIIVNQDIADSRFKE